MYAVYTEEHRLHATEGLVVEGEPLACMEIPPRALAIRDAIQAARLCPIVEPRDFGLAPILAVHQRDYIDYLRTAYERNARFWGGPRPLLVGTDVRRERDSRPPENLLALQLYYTYDYEDPIVEGTWHAAYWSAQCALTAANGVADGARAVYAICRPPGHHATTDQYGGFCYLNNAAIVARALAVRGAGRVAILDLDYHHGNGTQSIFYSDPQVLYASLHGDPALDYPHHWGYASERGEGAGYGTNYNWPLPLETDDEHYVAALSEALTVIAHFGPAYLVVSLGLDIAGGDLIGKFRITGEGLARIGRDVASLFLPTVIVQEGGYTIETLGQHVLAFLAPFA